MNNWTLTPILAATALTAALVVPDLLTTPPDDPTPVTSLKTQLIDLIPHTLQRPTPSAPTSEGNLTITAQLDQSTLLQSTDQDQFLVVSFTASDTHTQQRQPIQLAVVVDTSGSMSGEGKIDYARAATRELVDQLHPDDTFALITFDSYANLRLPAQPVTDKAAIHAAINRLEPFGSTNLSAGLAMGLDQLEALPTQGVRRVVVISDGQSPESREQAAALAASRLEANISVSALGLGIDFDDNLLLAIAGAGGGQYNYVDDPAALSTLLSQELKTLSHVATRGVSLSVDTADGVEVLDVYGYEEHNGAITDDGYRAYIGDMYAGETRKVVARVRIPDGPLGHRPIAGVTVHYDDIPHDTEVQVQRDIAVTITDDPALASASVNPAVGALATLALAGDAAIGTQTAWMNNDTETMQSSYESTLSTLKALEGRYKLPEVTERREAFEADYVELLALSQGTRYARSQNISNTFHNKADCF